ncbi:MAG: hypothetical protein Q7S52_01730 [bacterium]|nr:hypothetical protein [bacterium]
MDLKKGLLWASAGIIGFAGVMTALFFLTGSFGDTQLKLILSTFTLGGFGLTASLTMQTSKTPGDAIQSGVGGFVALIGVLIAMHLIWGERGSWFSSESDNEWKFALTMATLSFSLAWVAQLRTDLTHIAVKWCSGASIALIVATELMVLLLIWSEGKDMGEGFYRVLATVVVLAVTGSGIKYIVRKLTEDSSDSISASSK